jgi:hypothetical protein
VDDAAHNLRFVELGRGIHNVFYAADLLRRGNEWADRAMALVGAAPPKADDALVRGGYCAALCHEPAGMKLRETVTFQQRALPHARHVAELGATCTTCHSAESHKALSATPATCAGCHHGPKNDRCEGCHAAQSAFYRGRAAATVGAIAPNVMADAVGCTGCHDRSLKPGRAGLAAACAACHEPQYAAILPEWTGGFAGDVRRTTDAVRRAETAVARAPAAARRTAGPLLREARDALAAVRRGGPAHNPLAADALLEAARRKAQEAVAATRPPAR